MTEDRLTELKKSEAILIRLLFDFKLKLWESLLTKEEKQELEYRFNILEKSTFETFKNKYVVKDTVGNV
ncbi:MAG TPA: hypothetical protein VMS35_03405 [Nitrososphaeraceae archaeon]|nr:hypothetical protein [Nitrososphaeraceae archaeon]